MFVLLCRDHPLEREAPTPLCVRPVPTSHPPLDDKHTRTASIDKHTRTASIDTRIWQEATKARFREMVREIAERRDSRDDADGPVPPESFWAAKPDLNMQQVTAQVRRERWKRV